MRVKGKFFPSFEQHDGSSSKRLVRNYTGRPQSEARQLRNMRQLARPIIDSKDVQVISVGDKVIRLCLDEPNPEFSALHLICAGIAMSKATGEPWTACMLTIIQKFEERSTVTAELDIADNLSTQPQATSAVELPPVVSKLRQWFQSLVPRSLRVTKERDA